MIDDELAREGLEHLQAAAREMLAAARAMLDVMEELVEDPSSVTALMSSLGAAARAAAAGWPFTGARSGEGPSSADGGGPGGVERIHVS